MSFYIFFAGMVKYKNKQDYDKAINILEKQKYMNKKGNWLDECDCKISDFCHKDDENLLLDLEGSSGRNFHKVFKSVVKEIVPELLYAYAWSHDGEFDGYVFTLKDGEIISKSLCLKSWAKRRKIKITYTEDKTIDPECMWSIIEEFENYHWKKAKTYFKKNSKKLGRSHLIENIF